MSVALVLALAAGGLLGANPPGQDSMELRFSVVGGRIAVRGVKFHAEADAVRYDEGKGLLTVEGTKDQPAVLWRRHGEKEERIIGVRFLYLLKQDVVIPWKEDITR